VKLLVQPGDGVEQLIQGIEKAKKSVEIVIFRFDRRDIENALKKAVNRGVFVHALIAHANRGGKERLRRLEMRLLEAGGTVARTSDDLLRYHYKMVIIDRRILYLLAFNFTYLDIAHSRSFGIITSNRKLVQEAVKLFEADTRRQPYIPESRSFLVSPANSRAQLASFIKNTRKQLLIYDLKVSDRAMIRLIENRAKAGIEVRIIGRITGRSGKIEARRLEHIRMHTRTIFRDGKLAFIGSQSLRAAELDKRREVGVIVNDPKIVSRIGMIFEEDWAAAGSVEREEAKERQAVPLAKAARHVAKAFPPIAPVLEQAVKDVVGNTDDLDVEKFEETVKDAVKEAVIEAVQDAVQDAVHDNDREPGEESK